MESRTRTLVKDIVYRITGTLITFGISLLVTGSLPKASIISILTCIIKFVHYFLYERIWNQINWGRKEGKK